MVFTIDIGNSNIVVGTVNRQGVLFVERTVPRITRRRNWNTRSC